MIFEPTPPLDAQKCSSWTNNMWAKSDSPFNLYQRKTLNIVDISFIHKTSFPQTQGFFFPFCRQNRTQELWSPITVQTIMSYIRTFHFRYLTNRNSLSKRCMTQMALPQNSPVTSRC